MPSARTPASRLLQIERDTYQLLAEAHRKGWEGEAAGLQDALHRVADKNAQAERIQANSRDGAPTWCG